MMKSILKRKLSLEIATMFAIVLMWLRIFLKEILFKMSPHNNVDKRTASLMQRVSPVARLV